MDSISNTPQAASLDLGINLEEKSIRKLLHIHFTNRGKTLLKEGSDVASTCGYLFEIIKSCWTISRHDSSFSLHANSIRIKIPNEYGPLCKHLAETPSVRYTKTAMRLLTSKNTESHTTLIFGPAQARAKQLTEEAHFKRDCKNYLKQIEVPKESLEDSANYLWAALAITHTAKFTEDGTIMTTEPPNLFGISISESEAALFETEMANIQIPRDCKVSYKGKAPIKGTKNFLFQFGLDETAKDCVQKIALALFTYIGVDPPEKRIRILGPNEVAIVLPGSIDVRLCLKILNPIVDSHDCDLRFTGIYKGEQNGATFTELMFESPEFDF